MIFLFLLEKKTCGSCLLYVPIVLIRVGYHLKFCYKYNICCTLPECFLNFRTDPFTIHPSNVYTHLDKVQRELHHKPVRLVFDGGRCQH